MPIKNFSEFDNKENKKESKESVINGIISNFQKFVNSTNENDNGAMIMLTAALAVLNVSTSPQAVQAARRLSQMAIQRASKKTSTTQLKIKK